MNLESTTQVLFAVCKTIRCYYQETIHVPVADSFRARNTSLDPEISLASGPLKRFSSVAGTVQCFCQPQCVQPSWKRRWPGVKRADVECHRVERLNRKFNDMQEAYFSSVSLVSLNR